MIRKIPVLYIFIFLFSCRFLYAADPLWLQLDTGKEAVSTGDLGHAVLIFREILKQQPNNPEAQKWLGIIYEKEGEFSLAELQFKKALKNKKNMLIKEDEYYISYHLSEIYAHENNWKEYVNVLQQIITDASCETITPSVQHQMTTLLQKSGIDKFFELYRPEAKITLKAHYLLGMYYFKREQYTDALNHFIFSLGEPVHVMIDEIKTYDPSYSYEITKKISPMEKLLQEIRANKRITAYLNDVSFYKSFLYTGESVVYNGNKTKGMQMVELVIQFSPELELRNRARMFYIQQ